MELANKIFLELSQVLVAAFFCCHTLTPSNHTHAFSTTVNVILTNLLFFVRDLFGFSIYGGFNLVKESFKEGVGGNRLLNLLVIFLDFEVLKDAIRIP